MKYWKSAKNVMRRTVLIANVMHGTYIGFDYDIRERAMSFTLSCLTL